MISLTARSKSSTRSRIISAAVTGVIISSILHSATATATMNRTLYQSPDYTVSDSNVRQGEYLAMAESRDRLTSNYAGMVGRRVPRIIPFKFSINGKDNERPPYRDHHMVVAQGLDVIESPVIVFGEDDPFSADPAEAEAHFLPPGKEVDIRFRVDMNHVLRSFQEFGYYEFYDGTIITEEEFDGVFIAGGTHPLTWDFTSLPGRPDLRLNDDDGDGIFEQIVHFGGLLDRTFDESGNAYWERSLDLSEYPSYRSEELLVDALYTLSLEELELNIRPDGAFMAGKEWTGVWTRDISYSILLSLALLDPDACRTSLMAKVDDGRIIQDTGTGGSWPVSTDRMTWALAAWEVYKATGDRDWLSSCFDIIRQSAQADSAVVFDEGSNLVFGESSFLDWREQTYPAWMDPVDIFHSKCLGTNAVHYETYRILERMDVLSGGSGEPFRNRAESIRTAMNTHFWAESRGYYGQYEYGNVFPVLSPRSETLGEALTVLFGIAPPERARSVLEHVPVLSFGTPCIYPQIPGIPPYHNNGIWPFVQAFWTWAAASTGNGAAVEHGLAAIYRAAALFLTNKENMVAETGDFAGTEINSDRQLWSVAGNLAMTLRVLMGIRLLENRLELHPCIPEAYDGRRTLSGLRYRDSILDITITGFGTTVLTVTMDGEEIEGARIPDTVRGRHSIDIQMGNNPISGSMTLVENHTTVEIPEVKLEGNQLIWEPVEDAMDYIIYRNGHELTTISSSPFALPPGEEYAEYQVAAAGAGGHRSFFCEPVGMSGTVSTTANPALYIDDLDTRYGGYTGNGYAVSRPETRPIPFPVDIERPGWYWIDLRYANGSGPVNTDNKCATRSLSIDGVHAGTVVMPQRGTDAWEDWGYSSDFRVFMDRGKHEIRIAYDPWNRNMNGAVDIALIDHLRLRLIEPGVGRDQ